MQTIPYGSWPSPIDAESTTKAGTRFGDIVRADGGDLYWVESRPAEGGRSVIVRSVAGRAPEDVTPQGWNVRTRVHEYGGAAYAVSDGDVWFSSFADQRVYHQVPGSEPVAITPEPEIPAGVRFADFTIAGGRILCVRETHHADREPTNEIVALSTDGAEDPIVIASGRDFYAAPRVSPDGTRVAWLAWDHPNMPWDETELWTSSFEGSEPRREMGEPGEALVQPEWSPDGTLHVISDRTGTWQVHRAGSADPVLAVDGEVGFPHWVFGGRRYAFTRDGSIVLATMSVDNDRLLVVDPDGAVRELDHPEAQVLSSQLTVVGDEVVTYAGGPGRPAEVVAFDLGTGAERVVRAADPLGFDHRYVSFPTEIAFDTPDGPAYAVYFPPTNPEVRGPEDTAPPLIVEIHGGPTSQSRPSLIPEYLYWTSRGFAILDVNYGGSTGYGTAYRRRLNGRWGVVDVRDCALAAAAAAERGLADPTRLVIRGGSAGGFTALAAVAYRDEFAAAVSYFGVADLSLLAEHTHKFESHYLDSLVGRYPEDRSVYDARSPIHHLDGIDVPVLLFQGLEDLVVPPEQARVMFDGLRGRGVPVGLIEYEGEGHGFRRADNQVRTIEAELWFYGRVLGFEPADEIESVDGFE